MLRSVTFLFLLIVVGCKCPKKAAVGMAAQESDDMELTLLLSDHYGGTEGEELQVFRSQGELKKFFARVNKTRKPGLAVPDVDFGKQMVLLYCPGKSTAAGLHTIEMRPTKDDQVLIEPRKSKRKEGVTAGAVTMPFSLYTVQRSDKEFVLQANQ